MDYRSGKIYICTYTYIMYTLYIISEISNRNKMEEAIAKG